MLVDPDSPRTNCVARNAHVIPFFTASPHHSSLHRRDERFTNSFPTRSDIIIMSTPVLWSSESVDTHRFVRAPTDIDELRILVRALFDGLEGSTKTPSESGVLRCLRFFRRLIAKALVMMNAVTLEPLRHLCRKIMSSWIGKVLGAVGATLVGVALLRRGFGGRKERLSTRKRVCVVGGGIAGTSAAWALEQSGFSVTLHETKNYIGGNAKSHTWKVGQRNVTTGLSVLAWPGQKFHNYGELMRRLDVKTVTHDLRFFVGKKEKDGKRSCVYAHGRPSHSRASLRASQPWLASDLENWDRCVRFIRRVNDFFSPPTTHRSIYRNSKLNPLNVVSLYTVAHYVFGVSRRFWDEVFVPVHTSTFLETHMDDLPAVIAELLEDIVPLSDPEVYPVMDTWENGHAREVFDKLTAGLIRRDDCHVYTSNGVSSVTFMRSADDGSNRVLVLDEDGDTREYDHIIFACGAPAVSRITKRFSIDNPSFVSSLSSLGANWMLQFVLSRISYTESRDTMFLRGSAHSDAPRVLPKQYEGELLRDYCNYVEVQDNETTRPRYENSFIISSWCPPTLAPGVKGKRPMLVSYNCEERLEGGDVAHYERNVTGKEAHPCLTMTNLAMSNVVWPWLQGMHGGCAYFCGSFVTPGNGHDLSMLSGLVVAHKLGATYPFDANEKARVDFELMKGMMGLTRS